MSLLAVRSVFAAALGMTLGAVGEARWHPRAPAPPLPSVAAAECEPCRCAAAAPVRCVQVAAPEVGHPVAGIAGRVVDQHGNPLKATVRAEAEDEVVIVKAGSDGLYSIDLPHGEFTLSAEAASPDGDGVLESEKIEGMVIAAGERLLGVELRVAAPEANPAREEEEAREAERRREDRFRERARYMLRMECVHACQGRSRAGLTAECQTQAEQVREVFSECAEGCTE